MRHHIHISYEIKSRNKGISLNNFNMAINHAQLSGVPSALRLAYCLFSWCAAFSFTPLLSLLLLYSFLLWQWSRKVSLPGLHSQSPITLWSLPLPFLLPSLPCLLTAPLGSAAWALMVTLMVKMLSSKRYFRWACSIPTSFFSFPYSHSVLVCNSFTHSYIYIHILNFYFRVSSLNFVSIFHFIFGVKLNQSNYLCHSCVFFFISF